MDPEANQGTQTKQSVPASPAKVEFSIPETYKDKAYLKGVDSMDKLFQKLDGAQSLLGKRPAGIPDEKASDEEWEKFSSALRPEKAEDYEFQTPEELKDLKRDVDFEKSVKQIMYEAGVSRRQAVKLQVGYEKLLATREKTAQEQVKQLDVEFEQQATTLFGANKDKALSTAKSLIDEFMPETFKTKAAQLPNDQLLLFASVLNGLKNKYIREDGADRGSAGGAQQSVEELRAEVQTLMGTDEYRNFRHPKHAGAVQRRQEIYDKIEQLTKKSA